MKILVDIDETLNNLIETILPLYNAKYQDNVKIGDITEYDIHKFLKPECQDIFKEFISDELIENLQVSEGAVEALTAISQYDDIYFLTAAHPKSVLSKHRWLKRHFPFYHSDKLITCRDKKLIAGDIIIDDCPHFLQNSPCPVEIVFKKPWNRGYRCDYALYGYSMQNWSEFANVYKHICGNFGTIEKLRQVINNA